MRILSQYDMEQALSLEQIMDQVEQAYRLDRQGQAVTPPRPQVEQGGRSILDLLTKVTYGLRNHILSPYFIHKYRRKDGFNHPF